MTFASPWYFLLMLPIAGLILLQFSARQRGTRPQKQFVAPALIGRLVRGTTHRDRRFGFAFMAGSLFFLTLAMTQPQWGQGLQDLPRRGRDIIVVLDTSLSMLAEDTKPNRLQRAKWAIRDLVEEIQKDGGHRLALVGFAGRATLQSPPTLDYNFFLRRLDELGIGTVTRQGSLIGDALKQTLDGFGGLEDAFTDIILISDGEDHDSFPLDAAREAASRNIAIHTVGIGDSTEGAPVPQPSEDAETDVLIYQGEEVKSKLHQDLIIELAQKTNGMAIISGTGPVDLLPIYRTEIAKKPRRPLDESENERPVQRFQWFVGLSLLLLFGDMIQRRRHAKVGT